VACPHNTETHSSYFSLADNRRRFFLGTVESDIVNSLQIGRTHRPVAGHFCRDLLHELRRRRD